MICGKEIRKKNKKMIKMKQSPSSKKRKRKNDSICNKKTVRDKKKYQPCEKKNRHSTHKTENGKL